MRQSVRHQQIRTPTDVECRRAREAAGTVDLSRRPVQSTVADSELESLPGRSGLADSERPVRATPGGPAGRAKLCANRTARLMVIGTYRPADVALADYPLKVVKPDLLIHQLCRRRILQDEPNTRILTAATVGFNCVPGQVTSLLEVCAQSADKVVGGACLLICCASVLGRMWKRMWPRLPQPSVRPWLLGRPDVMKHVGAL
jgi:hypothetical protein